MKTFSFKILVKVFGVGPKQGPQGSFYTRGGRGRGRGLLSLVLFP